MRTLPRAIALMYHDVVEPGEPDASGFPGGGPARYKLDWPLFRRHLEALATTGRSPEDVRRIPCARREGEPWPLLLTFDDGGASAEAIASTLAEAEWTGHFFVTVDRIGTPGFLAEDAIRRIAEMGHVIGTHSCSHHVPFNELPEEELLDEWSRSIAVLRAITGADVVVGSVPGGYFSRRVGNAAAEAGLEALFTSEPVARARQLDGCLLLGRYGVLAGTSPATVRQLADAEIGPRLRQLVSWRTKGVAKAVLGDAYRSLRSRVLEKG